MTIKKTGDARGYNYTIDLVRSTSWGDVYRLRAYLRRQHLLTLEKVFFGYDIEDITADMFKG